MNASARAKPSACLALAVVSKAPKSAIWTSFSFTSSTSPSFEIRHLSAMYQTKAPCSRQQMTYSGMRAAFCPALLQTADDVQWNAGRVLPCPAPDSG